MNHGLPCTLGILLGPGNTATEDIMLALIQLSLQGASYIGVMTQLITRFAAETGKGCSQKANKSKARPNREVGS